MSYVLTSARLRRRRGLADATPSYNLIGPYGPRGNAGADPSQIDIPSQIAIQMLAGAPTNDNPAGVHTWAAWCSAFRSVTGQSCPAGAPFNDSQYNAEFWTFWEILGQRMGWPLAKWSVAQLTNAPLPQGAMTPAQYAALYPQNVGVAIDPAQVAAAEALTAATAAASGTKPANGAPAGSSTDKTAGGDSSGFNLGGLLSGSALGIPIWAWLAGGAGAVFLFGRGR